MPYSANQKSTGLEVLTDVAQNDLNIIGDVSDSGRAKAITQDNMEIHIANSSTFSTALVANSSFITGLTANSSFITNVNANSPLTTKGDIYTRGASAVARLPVGTNGQVLSADSTQATGLKWVDQSSGGGGGGGTKIGIGTTAVTLTGTTTETALFTQSISAGLLGTNNAVKFKINISDFDYGGGYTLTLRLKYGTTTIATIALTNASQSVVDSKGWIEGYIVANASATAQKGAFSMILTSDLIESINEQVVGSASGTSAETSSGALNLVVTAQWSNTSGLLNLVSNFYVVESVLASTASYSSGIVSTITGQTSTVIAHSLGRTPSRIRIITAQNSAGGNLPLIGSTGTYNGTTNYSVNTSLTNAGAGSFYSSVSSTRIVDTINVGAGTQNQATATVDATNITLTWAANSISTNLFWEAFV